MSQSTVSFDHLHVAAFESRRAAEMAKLIERSGGIAYVSPSMREVPISPSPAIANFANRLMTGHIDVVIFLTGIGTRWLAQYALNHAPQQRFLDSLRDTATVARGPKPQAALKELGISPTISVGPPNTWREILASLDEQLPVARLTVAVQEYGIANVSLTAGLEARGAVVEAIPVYRWDLPEETSMLQENVRRIALGEIDVVLFTAAQQVVHMLKIASELQLETELRAALQQTVIASIGPTTSQMLRAQDIGVDMEPSHSKMGQLVHEAASKSHQLLSRKRKIARLIKSTASASPDIGAIQHKSHNSPFMRACRQEQTPYTPIWLMRQAGRYMAEYRAVREKTTFLELCKNPQLCSEVMCTAVERLGVDAAIIFSDLLPILEPMGMDLEFAPGEGPIIHNPVRNPSDVHRVIELESVDSLHFVMETVAITRRDLPESIPLIGFSGAPFTLASYAIEGGSSRNFLHTKSLMVHNESAWHDLMEKLSRSIVRYLNAQIRAGAQAVQLFDSWVGCLGPRDYRQYVLPHVRQIAEMLIPSAPLIHFATGNPALLPLLAEAGGDVIGIDWRIDLDQAWKIVGPGRAVQGNLDPAVLLASRQTIADRTKDILAQAAGRPGHIFNLGHGVHQQTPVDNARALVDTVHEQSAR
jgi:uroporphyrinogen decarboxylase